mmetsp:Transcript_39187/g.79890  ORF Transcript_39187/g.79890 Transcript_39187/m.79890 type:complete len:95 (+) Transcript_39187:784-1068(+)
MGGRTGAVPLAFDCDIRGAGTDTNSRTPDDTPLSAVGVFSPAISGGGRREGSATADAGVIAWRAAALVDLLDLPRVLSSLCHYCLLLPYERAEI